MLHHSLAVACGSLAVALAFWGTAVQYWRIRLRGIDGVSLATWTLFILMGAFWITYGVVERSAVIVLGSLLVWPLQAAIVVRLRPWHSLAVVARSVGFAALLCVAPTVVWGWSAGVLGTGVAMVLNRTPQIAALVRHRHAGGVSAAMWSINVVGAALWVIYYQQARLWAALASTGLAGLASLAIALLTRWRHAQAESSAPVAVSLAQA